MIKWHLIEYLDWKIGTSISVTIVALTSISLPAYDWLNLWVLTGSECWLGHVEVHRAISKTWAAAKTTQLAPDELEMAASKNWGPILGSS